MPYKELLKLVRLIRYARSRIRNAKSERKMGNGAEYPVS